MDCAGVVLEMQWYTCIIFAGLLNDFYDRYRVRALNMILLFQHESWLGSAGGGNESQAENFCPWEQGVSDRRVQRLVPDGLSLLGLVYLLLSISSLWILSHNLIPLCAILLAIALLLHVSRLYPNLQTDGHRYCRYSGGKSPQPPL